MFVRCSVLILAIVLSTGCSNTSTQAQAQLPAALIVLPGARNVRPFSQYAGTVAYELAEPYPADGVIKEIRRQLERAGWNGLREDWLNPDIESSLVQGWVEYDDAVPGHRQGHVFMWMAQWEDSTGRLVLYNFQYYGTPNGKWYEAEPTMKVTAALFDAKDAALRRSFAVSRKKGQ